MTRIVGSIIIMQAENYERIITNCVTSFTVPILLMKDRSSRPEVFYKKGVLIWWLLMERVAQWTYGHDQIYKWKYLKQKWQISCANAYFRWKRTFWNLNNSSVEIFLATQRLDVPLLQNDSLFKLFSPFRLLRLVIYTFTVCHFSSRHTTKVNWAWRL